MDYLSEARAMQAQLIAWRRDLHQHPELGFREVRTAGIAAAHLTSLGYEVYTGLGKTGVVGVLKGGQPGRTVLLRGDMDALPIQEQNQVAYASQNPGVMHACGHDAHTATLMGVATLLAKHRQSLRGTVKLVFQPAEEGMDGARRMIEDGAIDRAGPRPDASFALHVWSPLPVGKAAVTSGPMMAAADKWTVTVTGRGGHGALPHQTADPVVAAAQIITALQTVVSRNVDPQKTAVLTVGTLEAGTAFNIIPDKAEMTGTIRTFESAIRDTVLARCEAICKGMGEGLGVNAHWHSQLITPAVVNDLAATALTQKVLGGILGAENIETNFRTMGSEDMSEFMAAAPGAFVFLGSARLEGGMDKPHHNACFDIDESVLPLGVATLAEIATRYLAE